MTSERNNNTELGELIFAVISGTADDDQHARLEDWLAEDSSAMEYYAGLLTIYAGLRQSVDVSVSVIIPLDKAVKPEGEGIICEELAEYEKNGIPVEVERIKEPAESVLTEKEREAEIRAFLREERAMEEQERRLEEEARRKIRERELQRRRRVQMARTVVAKVRKYIRNSAIAAMLMVIGYLFFVKMQPVPPAYVATLTDGIDVKWADPELPAELGSLLRPGYMKLVVGVAQITFDGGAKAIIEAPVEIRLQNAAKVYLQSGKMRAIVCLEARGFTVNTPSASIVDLGTEFGIDVKEDGSSDIHVYEGRVSLLAGKIDDIVGKLSNKVEQIVEAGQARRVKAGSLRIDNIQFGRTRSARNIPSPYELAVRKTDPIAYWNFNLSESKCHNQIDGKIKPIEYSKDVLRTNNGPKLSDRAENGALTILHQRPPTMSLVDIPLYRHTSNGFTIMFWYQPLVLSPHSIITQDLDTNKSTDFGRWFDLEINGKLTFGSGTGMNNAEKYQIIDTNKPVKIDQWIYVVVTITTEGQGWLYINGRREKSNKGYEYQFDYEYQSDPERKYADIVFGCFDVEDLCRDVQAGKPIAIIDGLAVYDYALSENTIRQIYNYYQPELNK